MAPCPIPMLILNTYNVIDLGFELKYIGSWAYKPSCYNISSWRRKAQNVGGRKGKFMLNFNEEGLGHNFRYWLTGTKAQKQSDDTSTNHQQSAELQYFSFKKYIVGYFWLTGYSLWTPNRYRFTCGPGLANFFSKARETTFEGLLTIRPLSKPLNSATAI